MCDYKFMRFNREYYTPQGVRVPEFLRVYQLDEVYRNVEGLQGLFLVYSDD